jgi:uncharacterized glyoxalase superfamily protein PhnB
MMDARTSDHALGIDNGLGHLVGDIKLVRKAPNDEAPDNDRPQSDKEDITVKKNRSIPSAPVIPVLTYPDVRAAVDWLAGAFGSVERVRIGEDHRSQLQLGDGAVIVADVGADRTPPRSGEVTHSVMVRVADAGAHCERARAFGARILMEPTDMPYGERQYTAQDLAGHQWTFSETIADTAPEEWGGTTVTP